MSKAMVNYIVDLAIGVAFVVASITGIVFLLPESWIAISESGQPTMLGVSMAMWNTLHEWSALIMIGGAVLHVVLHWRWVTMMTRKAFRPPRAAKASPHRVAAPVSSAVGDRRAAASRTAAAPARSQTAGSWVPGRDRPAGAAGDGAVAESTDGRRSGRERRVTRKTFLAGTAAACGGAALVVLLGRGTGSDAVSVDSGQSLAESDSGSGNGNSWGDGSSGEESAPADGSGSLSPDESDAGSLDGSDGGSTEAAPAPQDSDARVTVDTARCNGCGDCVSYCAYGVFTFDGSHAVAAAPEACTLCGRCVRVCPTQAITLRA